MRKRTMLSSAMLMVAAIAAAAQINLLSNSINFRTTANQAQRTQHYGAMDINYNGSDAQVLRVYCNASTTSDRVAVYGYSSPSSGYGYGAHMYGGAIGIKAENSGTGLVSRSRFGAHFTGTGPYDPGQLTVGVYATASKAGNTTNCWAGYFGGSAYATVIFVSSDSRLKSNVRPLESSADKVLRLNPVRYQYDTDRYPALGLPQGEKIGLLAQDVATVFPELVTDVGLPEEQQKDGMTSIKAVDYLSLIPVLVGVIQQQQTRIASLEERLDKMSPR